MSARTLDLFYYSFLLVYIDACMQLDKCFMCTIQGLQNTTDIDINSQCGETLQAPE